MSFTPFFRSSLVALGSGLVCAATLFSPAFAGGGLKDDAVDAPPQRAIAFSGSDWVVDSSYYYAGLVVALNRDIGKDGVVFRTYGAYGRYEYDGGLSLGEVDGRAFFGDLMVGYKVNLSRLYVQGFVGVDFQDHDLSPNDPDNDVSGSEAGFKVALDLGTTDEKSPFYFTFNGSYSTAFDTYWTRARVGLTERKITVGVEGIAFGNEGFDAQRIGGFLIWRYVLRPNVDAEFNISVGHQFADDDNNGSVGGAGGGSGTYVGIGHSISF